MNAVLGTGLLVPFTHKQLLTTPACAKVPCEHLLP
jgi:hypothetical protein